MARPTSRSTAIAVLIVAVALLGACDWTQSRFGPENTGFNPVEDTIGPATVAGLRLRWSQQTGNGQPIDAEPTIANGVLYARSDKLYAFDASNGSARWASPIPGFARSSPTVASGVVYVSGGDRVYTFDATTGVPRWSSVVSEAYGSPTVANGIVYVNADKLYALNAATGVQLWSAAVYAGNTSPAVANGVVYTKSTDKLYAFSATTGVQLWSAAAVGLSTSPAVANGVVYVGSQNGLLALNALTGVLIWTAPVGGRDTSLAIANGVVYVSVDKLYAFNAMTGAQLWSVVSDYLPGSPSVANGVVFVRTDKLHAFKAATGAQLWSADVRPDAVVIANGVVYTAGSGIHAYSLPTTTPQLVISPAFTNDYVVGEPNGASTTYTITNVGSTPTSVITNTLTGPGAPHFRLASDGCTDARLAGGASCTVIASFVPTSAGSHTALLTSTAAAGGRATALLGGTAPPLTLSPNWTQLPDIFAGSTSTTTFTITNLAPAPIGPLAESITGDEFTITADACAGKTVTPGSSCTIAVTFAPTVSYDQSAVLVSEAPGHRVEALIQGRALARIAVTPSTMNFGSVPVGTTKSATFTVTNISPSPTNPLTETIEDVWGSDRFLITHDACAGRRLAANASCTVTVTFAPLVGGSALGRLRTATSQGGDSTAFLIGTT